MAVLRDHIFQTSDLAGAERKTFIEAARRGRAYLRAPDGESLVMLRESELETAMAIKEVLLDYVNVLRAVSEPLVRRAPSDYGRWAFLAVFEDEDLNEFLAEMDSAIVRGASLARIDEIEQTLSAWRQSARTLSDPTSRSILMGEASNDWLEASAPNVG